MKKLFLVLLLCLLLFGLYLYLRPEALLRFAVDHPSVLARITGTSTEDKEDLTALADIAAHVLTKDGVTRSYLILLQNNLELRPGGGFLGQYARVEIKNGKVLSYKFEDANLLDERYKSDRLAPPEFQKYANIKKWKFRDSNTSPDFPVNVEQALHFYALAGEDADVAGVFAVNATMLEDILEITGPLTVSGYEEHGEFTAENVLIALEDAVEEKFARADKRADCEKQQKAFGNSDAKDVEKICAWDAEGKKLKKVTHADKVARKDIIGVFGDALLAELIEERPLAALASTAFLHLESKDLQLWFRDEALQNIVEEKMWDGTVDAAWDGDYLMIVDANIGALKTDYYMERVLEYTVDFTGSSAEKNDAAAGRMVRYKTPNIYDAVENGTFVTERPLATTRMIYKNTATEANYRTSDYHSFSRMIVPEGSAWWIREWFEPPSITENLFGNKQSFDYKFDVLLGDTIPTMLQYELPGRITEEGYKLKIQRQSGVGDVPLTVRVITGDGVEHKIETTLDRDKVFLLEDGELNER